MKKLLVILCVFGAVAAMAQVTSNQFITVPASPLSISFDWKVFVQQILSNGGLVLLMFLSAKIPVVGPWIVKILDVFIGNPKH